ncbi:periplasmic binding protein-like II [Anaeromyces robustus]|uniref:Periplasmic binding protein-like II n=1 Tax=Anaeromyces robustus TaxID=1754192 RepID=A0A1Y1VSH6_9FUNG|nr:periplasmic binding protein-like II [Anaeromyces robustus]|eukprot:ORX64250.1 periplasmic binding protein-like II [Anaeromyces robustus]
MIIRNIFILTFLLSFAYIGNAIDILGIASSENGAGLLYNKLAGEFNEYAKKKELDITVTVNLLSKENSTVEVTDYESTLDSLLPKKSEKYDIIFYDNIFTSKYGQHFVNLKEVVSDEYFKLYEKGIAPQSCVYDNKWVAFPVSIDLSVLYYNKDLLDKYHKSPPKTWNELRETTQYIMSKENNKDLVGYNGLFPDNEIGTCSLYEFFYTFRDKPESSYPSFDSKEAKDAFNMLIKLKEEVASDDIFKQDIYFAIDSLDKNNLFTKSWYVPSMTNSSFTLIPGNKEGVTGSTIGGFNVAINKYVKSDNQKAAAKFIEFLASKDIQKEIVMENKVFSALPSIYDDADVCNIVECEVFKNVQLITRPSSKYNDYSTFSQKFRKAVYDGLYEDKSVEETLKNIKNIVDDFASSYLKKSYYGLITYFIIYFIYYLYINF